MLLGKSSILFFCLRAAHLRGITVVPVPARSKATEPGITPLYSRIKLHLWHYNGKYLLKYMIIAVCMLLATKSTHAQAERNYADSNRVDTISMHHIEPVHAPSEDTAVTDDESAGYDDQDDGYVDTTIRHIYDTSQFFFNWKSYYDDPFSKQKLKQRHLIDAEVKALKKNEDFWYIPAVENLELRIKNDPQLRDSLLKKHNHQLTDENQQSFVYEPWFNTLLWVIIIGIFVAAIVYFLVQNKINIFSKEAASLSDEATEDVYEDIFSLSYTKLIQQAEKEKDYRVAIRLMFLQILKSLSDVGAIQYQPDHTDLEYLQQLSQSKYYKDFFNVMRSYEYAWYGKFFISPEKYATIKNDFLKLQHGIR